MYNILLVDYSRRFCKELEHVLQAYKFPLTIKNCVTSPSSALVTLSEGDFNVIIVHTEQCDSAGLWMCHHIRKTSDIPILLLGGRDQFRLVRKALTYQVNDYLPSPVRPSALLHSLHELLNRLNSVPVPVKKSSPIQPALQLNGKAIDSGHVIRIIKGYVRDHLREEITLKKMADMLHFNCAYLGQKFKMEENVSFNNYLLLERMKKAKQLLLSTDMRIYEIALEVGYRDIDWFYKKFKAYAGSSPNAYRRQKANSA